MMPMRTALWPAKRSGCNHAPSTENGMASQAPRLKPSASSQGMPVAVSPITLAPIATAKQSQTPAPRRL